MTDREKINNLQRYFETQSRKLRILNEDAQCELLNDNPPMYAEFSRRFGETYTEMQTAMTIAYMLGYCVNFEDWETCGFKLGGNPVITRREA